MVLNNTVKSCLENDANIMTHCIIISDKNNRGNLAGLIRKLPRLLRNYNYYVVLFIRIFQYLIREHYK